jgi:hypothetical protein
MFNSHGNISVDPATALLFVDFHSGRTVQLSGRAVLQWGEARDERSVRFNVDDVVVTSRPALTAREATRP